MSTVADELNKILNTKNALKDALIEKGQDPGDVFSQYPDKIRAIQTDRIVLTNIEITKQPTKTSYTAFETFDPEGMEVKAIFSNGAYKFVSDFTIASPETLQVSDTKVNIKYTEFGVTVEAEVPVTVSPIKLNVPSNSETFVYTGSEMTPVWTGYDSSLMTIGGDTSGTNAGTYSTNFAIKDRVNYRWSDGSIAYKTVIWTIGKAQASITLDKTEVVLSPDKLSDTVTFSSVGMSSVVVMSSDMSVATVSMEDNVITITSVNNTTGTANIIISGEVDSNYNAPEYPSIEVSAEFIVYATVTLKSLTNNSYSYSYAQATIDGITYCVDGGGAPDGYIMVDDIAPVQISVPIGTEIQLDAGGSSSGASRNKIYVNNTSVGVDGDSANLVYTHIVSCDTTIEMEGYYNKEIGPSMYASYGCIYITEIPEGYALVTITGGVTSMRDDIENVASVTINGTTYSDSYGLSETLVVPVGTEIYCTAIWGDYAEGGRVYVNGTQVGNYNFGTEYTYIVNGDVSIKLERTNMYGNGGYWGSNVRITEQ